MSVTRFVPPYSSEPGEVSMDKAVQKNWALGRSWITSKPSVSCKLDAAVNGHQHALRLALP